MRKKHYDPNTLFFVVYAVNEKEEIGKPFKIKIIENITLDLHNFLEDREIDVSDGEIALELLRNLENLFVKNSLLQKISLINWYELC